MAAGGAPRDVHRRRPPAVIDGGVFKGVGDWTLSLLSVARPGEVGKGWSMGGGQTSTGLSLGQEVPPATPVAYPAWSYRNLLYAFLCQ